MEWGWDPLESIDVNVSDNTFKALIHPNSSRGTGAVRGDMPFEPGHVYYWEIKVEGSPMATDMVTHYNILVLCNRDILYNMP